MYCGAKTQNKTECKVRIDRRPCRYHLTKAPRLVQRSNIVLVKQILKTWPDRPDFWSKHDKISRIGRGGYSEVLLVRNVETQITYALKLFKTERLAIVDDSIILERLHHPGVIECYEKVVVDRHGKRVPGLMMQYIEGSTLNRQGTCNSGQVRDLLKSSLEALGYIHSQGVIHGDIKPSNLIVKKGTRNVVFLDFGLSHFFQDRSDLLQLDACTPLYSAPEMIAPTLEEWDKSFESLVRADIFSLGVTFYVVITQKEPDWVVLKPRTFLSETFATALDIALVPLDDPVLTNAVKRMMAFALTDRPSIQELLDDLK